MYVCIQPIEMRIISVRVLREFYSKHSDAKAGIELWVRYAKLKGRWSNLNDVKSDFPKASILKNNRVVFDIGGNKYRLIVKFEFASGCIYIRFIGSHSNYDKVDANKV